MKAIQAVCVALLLCLVFASSSFAKVNKKRSTLQSFEELQDLRNSIHGKKVKAPEDGQINLWPLPVSYSQGSTSVYLYPANFQIQCASGGSCSSILKKALQRYTKYIFFADAELAQQKGPSATYILSVNATNFVPLEFGVDESYSLSADASGAVITANTEWGALRGLETFSGLVNWNVMTGQYSIDNLPVSISDYPRFSWRGLLIDTSRHYLPLNTILHVIDSMEINKLSVLHWHMVDEQSFPVVSITYPKLSQNGAWIPSTIYTHEDVRTVIKYANERGIRVMPEFDTPGHTASWKLGYPQLFPNCVNVRPVFDVTQNYTLNFIANFLGEMSALFASEKYIHLGGDEVNMDCWSQIPAIAAWMKTHNISSYPELQAYYGTVIEGVAYSLGKTPVYWDEVFGQSDKYVLKTTSVINVWNQDVTEVTKVVKAGYRCVFSSPWYLDQQQPGSQVHYAWIDTWRDFYSADPVDPNGNLTPDEISRILGAEMSMWGEAVDENCIFERIYPRGSAFCERAWSPQGITDQDQATPRFISHRCRMVRRGIPSGPLDPDFCGTGKPNNAIPQWKPQF